MSELTSEVYIRRLGTPVGDYDLKLREVVRRDGYIVSATVVDGAWVLRGDADGFWAERYPHHKTAWDSVEVGDVAGI